MGVGLAEPVRATQLDREGGQGNMGELGIEILGLPLVHFTEEAQRDVKVLQRPPARTRDTLLQAQIVPPDLLGHRNGGEQAQGHGKFLYQAEDLGRFGGARKP